MFIMTIVKYESTEEITLEDMMAEGEDDEMMERIFNNDNYKKALKLWLKFLNEKGILDVLITKQTDVV